ncbi:Deubiquitinating enzyme domain-containing protein [Phytophthora infestans]|uniref:Deubiquitinating enzyme domain-containing protein n=1 Tax=Phytophthora infestans TaxID=4787 RepID=A0A8S9TZX8_PHYIN|nr:Deubiquitinating enzyme domain-containing protein [Phytophthora infestans]
MSSPRHFRRSRMERASSADMTSSSSSSSLFRRFQGKKSTSKMSPESLAASQPPPRHSHRRMLSRDRKRPMMIYYSSNPANIVNVDDSKLNLTVRCTDAAVFTDGEMSEDDCDDRFDGDSKLPDFAASMGPRDTMARSRGPGRALMRMSQTFSRASERIDPHSNGEGRHRRAARQSAKYDVAWRQDNESECCQVCFAMFTKLSRRRHHCRVCGELVCGACSQDQVSLTDKFSTPRRACVACCSLLQAMARSGDDRVKVVESDMATATTTKRHHKSAPAPSTCHSPVSASMPAPAATPRYRDRLTEVHRVMAAGKLSRRRGSSEKKMYVISSRWLRSWLAFTSSASSSNSSRKLDYGFDTETSISSPTNDDVASMGRAPGPIDNLSLLELARGKLIRRPGLIRDEVLAGDAASAGEDADFQLLSPEVWEVFQRLYGGAPAIYVNLTSADPTAWIVDVSGLLAAGTNDNGTKVPVLPAVERALTSRHHSENGLIDPRGARTPTESDVYTPGSSRSTKQQTPKSPAWTATSSSSSSSLSEDKDRVRSPTGSGKMQLEDLESDVAALSIGVNKTPTEGGDDMRATTSARSPTAAFAASAFAVAMKQARLNAQKAIDDRASRVIAA